MEKSNNKKIKNESTDENVSITQGNTKKSKLVFSIILCVVSFIAVSFFYEIPEVVKKVGFTILGVLLVTISMYQLYYKVYYKFFAKNNENGVGNLDSGSDSDEDIVNVTFMKKTIGNYRTSLYSSIFLIVLSSVMVFFIGISSPSIIFQKEESLGIVETYLIKLGLIIPFAWLFLFSIKQFNFYERAIAIYNHKIDVNSLYKNLHKQGDDEMAQEHKNMAAKELLENPVNLIFQSKEGPFEKAVAQALSKTNINKIVDNVVNTNTGGNQANASRHSNENNRGSDFRR